MEQFLVWQDRWLLGIEKFDADHKEVVRLLNRMAQATQRNTTDDNDSESASSDNCPALKCLDKLVELLRAHFKREEVLMESIGYPDFEQHRREHVMELAEFIQIRQDLVSSESKSLDMSTLTEIKQWFLNHAVVEDQHYAAYYFETIPANSSGHNAKVAMTA